MILAGKDLHSLPLNSYYSESIRDENTFLFDVEYAGSQALFIIKCIIEIGYSKALEDNNRKCFGFRSEAKIYTPFASHIVCRQIDGETNSIDF